jgi:hypothetical protein
MTILLKFYFFLILYVHFEVSRTKLIFLTFFFGATTVIFAKKMVKMADVDVLQHILRWKKRAKNRRESQQQLASKIGVSAKVLRRMLEIGGCSKLSAKNAIAVMSLTCNVAAKISRSLESSRLVRGSRTVRRDTQDKRRKQKQAKLRRRKKWFMAVEDHWLHESQSSHVASISNLK